MGTRGGIEGREQGEGLGEEPGECGRLGRGRGDRNEGRDRERGLGEGQGEGGLGEGQGEGEEPREGHWRVSGGWVGEQEVELGKEGWRGERRTF